MEFLRLPRFRRSPQIHGLQITPRDLEIIRQVRRHRFLRSDQIGVLVSGSAQQVLRRLQLLFHHGYLERPRCQLDYFRRQGSRCLVYGLANAGARLLAELDGSTSPPDWTDKNRSVRQFYLQHTLLVAEVMVALERACHQSGHWRLHTEDESVGWQVQVKQQRLSVYPDKVFTLENIRSAERRRFFLEADRATMPVERRTLKQSSFQRKLLAYEATWKQGLHKERFRVLTVTSSAPRRQSLITACQRLERGQGLFLFTDIHALRETGDIFALPWQSGKGTEEYLFG